MFRNPVKLAVAASGLLFRVEARGGVPPDLERQALLWRNDTPELDQKLLDAASQDNVKAVRFLLDAGANYQVTDVNGRTPEDYAQAGGGEAARLLMHVRELFQAVKETDDHIIRKLQAGDDASAGCDLEKSAIRPVNGFDWIKLEEIPSDFKVNSKLPVNAVNSHGMTVLLHAAALGRSPEVVHKLIEEGADVNAIDRVHGRTPLMLAAEGNHVKVVEQLLKDDAKLHVKDLEGKIVVDFAVNPKKHTDVLQALLQGAQIRNNLSIEAVCKVALSMSEQKVR